MCSVEKRFSNIKCFGWCLNVLQTSHSPFRWSRSPLGVEMGVEVCGYPLGEQAQGLSPSVICGSPPLLVCGLDWRVISSSSNFLLLWFMLCFNYVMVCPFSWTFIPFIIVYPKANWDKENVNNSIFRILRNKTNRVITSIIIYLWGS